jgi:nicotinamide-nucleotide amidase
MRVTSINTPREKTMPTLQSKHSIRDGSVELLTIGAELLLGEIADTNARAIALALREYAFDLARITTVGDNTQAIAEAVRQAAGRASILITTGGLGPTVDDPTRAAVAEAAGVALEFHEELWQAIQARFQRGGRVASENNRAQAYLPAGATAIPNPVGSAPGFFLLIGACILIAMPGVPAEMEHMLVEQALPLMRSRRKDEGSFLMRTLHVGGLGESVIDERIGQWEQCDNPVVGLAAHNGLVDVRMVARGKNAAEAARALGEAEADIRARLAGYIFGTDEASLAESVLACIPKGKQLIVLESGTRGALCGQLEATHLSTFGGGRVLSPNENFAISLETAKREPAMEYLAAVHLMRTAQKCEAKLVFIGPHTNFSETRTYAVALSTVEEWAVQHLLFAIWKSFLGK